MSIYEKSVKKPITTALIFMAVIILGLFSYNKLAIDLYPEIDAPFISVITFYGGAGAEDIETNVSKILEDNLNTVNNLKTISSTSKDNVSSVFLEFEWGTDLDGAMNDVRDAVGRVERLLPDGVEKPTILKFSTNMMPIMFITATANESYNGLNKILEEGICNPLNRIDGVGAVSVAGGPEREIQVNIDPKKLEAYNLSVEQIGSAIAAENLNLPTGIMDVGSSTYSMRVEGEFKGSEIIPDIVVANYQGNPIYLRDVATVKDTTKDLSQLVSANGIPSAQIIITKQSGANTVKICKEVNAQLPELAEKLPPDIVLNVRLDSSENISNSINSLTNTVFYAAIFVVLVVLFFLGKWRATIIIIITIPVSLISAFIYLFITGNTINIISLSSLSIAIGMVVDDAIVVLENIMTHIKRGSTPREAAIYATNEVGVAVIATTLTIVAVFLPLTFLSGMSGIMFKQLGWVVTIVTVVSTIAALSLIPMMASVLLKEENKKKKKLTFTERLYQPIERGLDKFDNAYSKFLGWAIKRRFWVIGVAALMFLSSLFLITQVGTEFFPDSDDSQVNITVELPMGVRKEETAAVCYKIEDVIRAKYPEILSTSLTVGAADENNIFSSFSKNGSHIGTFSLKLCKPKHRELSSMELADLIRQDVATFPEIAQYTVKAGGSMGAGSSSAIEVKIFGHDIEQTTAVAEELARRMETLNGTRDIEISRSEMKLEYKLELDRHKLAAAGLNTATVANSVRNRINGLVASKYREDGNEYDITVRFDKPFRESIENVENIVVYNQQGQGVKVKELGRVIENHTLPEITRENRQRVVSVTCGVFGEALGNVVQEINGEINKMDIPQGIYTKMGGAAEDQAEAFGDLFTLLILIVLLVYIVMASQFESLRMPFIIMISVLFAFTGVFLTLYLTNTNLSLIALIGSIMLVGIVVKNGIVLVDYTNLQRDRGLSLSQAVITAGRSRLRPVLMTTLTTILGMFPLALSQGEGSEIWRPMGIAIIGGLTFSTILTLIVVPVIYSIFGAGRMKKERKRLAELAHLIND